MDEDEEEEVVLFNRNVEPEVDEEFNREFARIMSESLESRKASAKSAFDIEPPTIRSRVQSNNTDAPMDTQRVQFAVLSRRNKQVFPLTFSLMKMKIVDIPSENALAQTTLKHIEDAKAEKQRIKNLVLNLDRKAEEDERRQLERSAANNGIKITYGDERKQKRPPQSSWNYKDW
jgi:regulator of nonsense transcripts 2